jgi:hypothetical protein
VKRTLLIAGVLMAGCTHTSDFVQVGKDTYVVSSSSINMLNSGGTQTASLIKEAGVFCARSGKMARPIKRSAINGDAIALPSAEIMFKCLLETDPEWAASF